MSSGCHLQEVRRVEFEVPHCVNPVDTGLKYLIEEIVARAFMVPAMGLRQPSRGPARVAFARQTAMYLAHIACELTFTEVGDLFERDRTTVAHACGVVEDRRDDARLDRALDLLESAIRVVASATSHNNLLT